MSSMHRCCSSELKRRAEKQGDGRLDCTPTVRHETRKWLHGHDWASGSAAGLSVLLKDDESTRYYIDPQIAALLQRADATARWYRWLFGGLHRIDFTAWMRSRPACS